MIQGKSEAGKKIEFERNVLFCYWKFICFFFQCRTNVVRSRYACESSFFQGNQLQQQQQQQPQPTMYLDSNFDISIGKAVRVLLLLLLLLL